MPKVSVVIPLYNKEPHITRALNSVLNQTVQDFEVIVVDDGSTDGGAEIVRSFDDPRIRLIQQENRGVSAARNRGIEAAEAELIAFLDADDEWLPGFLATLSYLSIRYPKAGVYATDYALGLSNKNKQKPKYYGIPNEPWEGLLESYFSSVTYGDFPIRSSNIGIPKKIFDEVGVFKVNEWWGEDADMWARIALYYPIAFSRKCCSVYHIGAINRSNDIQKVVEYHPFEKSYKIIEEEMILSESLKLQIDEYIAREQISVAARNIRIGEYNVARKILFNCKTHKNLKKKYLYILLSYLPSPIYFYVIRIVNNLCNLVKIIFQIISK